MGSEKKSARLSLECIEPNAAGIDVGARSIYVAVGAEREAEPVRSFATFTEDLRAMAAWLKQCGITTIAMESTGVYWIPVYEVLEDAGFKVCLVNSHHVKNVPGRKSDVSDCQWLQYLHSVGLLQASFRPERDICALRALSRHRAGLVEVAAIHVQHMQKALTQMNLQIHHVLSDITGVSGLAVVDAILQGQRDPQQLAGLVQSRIHADRETVIKSLVGNYRAEHLFTLRQSLAAYRQYQKMLADCDREMEQYMRQLPDNRQGGRTLSGKGGKGKRRKNQFYFDMGKELYRVLGTDLTLVPGLNALTVHTLVAEVGLGSIPFCQCSCLHQLVGVVSRQQEERGQGSVLENAQDQQPYQRGPTPGGANAASKSLLSGSLLSSLALPSGSPAGHHRHSPQVGPHHLPPSHHPHHL